MSRSRIPAARRRQGGFTLLEVLIALSILGVSLAAIYEAFGVGLRNDAQARRHQEAVIVAEARLAEIGTIRSASVGTWRGETGGFRWTIRMAPAEDEPLAPKPGPAMLLEVEVAVAWAARGGENAIALRTFRLAQRIGS